jgi:tRNA (guanine-N7-)-methyltransferase
MLEQNIKSFVINRSRGINKQKCENIINAIDSRLIKIPSQILQIFNEGSYQNIVLEIGSGYGHSAINFCKQNKNTLYIACEVYIKGLANTFAESEKNSLSNLYLHSGDAVEFLNSIKLYNSVGKNKIVFDKILILYPDPWPKKKHNKRRIFNLKNLQLFASLLNIQSELFFATDHDDYKLWSTKIIVENFIKERSFFKWNIKSINDFLIPPIWWTRTKFEQKAINESRKPFYISLIKQ